MELSWSRIPTRILNNLSAGCPRAGIPQSLQRMATGWTIGWPGFDSWRGLGISLFATASRPALGTTRALSNVYQALLTLGQSGRGVKLATHLHLVPSSKNAWCYTATPQYVFMALCLIKHRDNFTVTEAPQTYRPVLKPQAMTACRERAFATLLEEGFAPQ
jgi:hypothetical protein